MSVIKEKTTQQLVQELMQTKKRIAENQAKLRSAEQLPLLLSPYVKQITELKEVILQALSVLGNPIFEKSHVVHASGADGFDTLMNLKLSIVSAHNPIDSVLQLQLNRGVWPLTTFEAKALGEWVESVHGTNVSDTLVALALNNELTPEQLQSCVFGDLIQNVLDGLMLTELHELALTLSGQEEYMLKLLAEVDSTQSES